ARHDALFRRLDEVMGHYPEKKVLVYTHLALEQEVQQKYKEVATQHFWSGRGKDEFKDYDVGVIFGTAEPNPAEVFDFCRALNADDPVPISPDPLPENHRHRKDERLETLLAMRREEEMEQAAHRLRGVWAEGNPKTIIIMSHLDLPGLPADEVIDPRGIEQMNRKELLSQFITDCMDQMGFYGEALAELAGVVSFRSKMLDECRERLARTASLIENSIRQSVRASDDAGSLYPQNRNAYTKNRNAILEAMELEEETLSFDRGNGKWITIKVWGDVTRAEAFFRALLSDQFPQKEPFSEDNLKAVCQLNDIEFTVLFLAPTRADAYYPLFSIGTRKSQMRPFGWEDEPHAKIDVDK
ncbi:hypothetical protein IH992_13335, partial [Candidatus Poribacteria bacterium]|nr:hypothetical protein [Candidatus Poribacteria bacterium]